MDRFKRTIADVTIAKINLQLLADTPINASTSANLAPEIKEHYDKTLIELAQPKLIHDQFAQTRNIPKNGGKTIEFRQFASLPKVTKPLTEGVAPEGSKLSVSKITATVEQYGDYVPLTDVVQLISIDPILVETVNLLGNQSGASLDTVTRDRIHEACISMYCDKTNASGDLVEVGDRKELDETATLTVDMINYAVAMLRGNNAPTIDGKYYAGIIHPYVAYDLMRDPEWVDVHKYTNSENIYEGEIGRIGGVRFFDTTEAKIFKDDETCPEDLAVFTTLITGLHAYGTTSIEGGALETIIKPLGSGGTSDPLNQKGTAGWKAMKTAEVLVPSYMVRLESISPRFSTTTEAN